MNRNIKKLFLAAVIFLGGFCLFNTAQATVTGYIRTPTGPSIESPVTITGDLSDPPEGALYWYLTLTGYQTGNNYSSVNGVGTTSIDETLNLSPDFIQGTLLTWCANDNPAVCNDNNLGTENLSDTFIITEAAATSTIDISSITNNLSIILSYQSLTLDYLYYIIVILIIIATLSLIDLLRRTFGFFAKGKVW